MNYVGLKAFLNDNKISFTENEPMKRHTTFKIGGAARIFAEPKTPKQLAALVNFCKTEAIPYFILGKGSNLLVSDEGIEGVVISTLSLEHIELSSADTVQCGAGAVLTNLCTFALKNSLSGLEFAFGIPGSVGGAVYMNAGAYGGEIKDCIVSATVLTVDGEIRVVKAEDMRLGYRTSIFKTDNSVILSAEFKLNKANAEEIRARMDDFITRRKTKQPLEFGSAGSTFKRPEGYFAGALIEEAGLKGFSIGDAQVSEKHAGFVINRANATAEDVAKLVEHIKATVLEKSGVLLEPEIIFVGKF